MKLGEKYVNTKIATVIEFTEVVEDSRCPKNTNCFWAGQIKVKFTVVYESKVEKDFVLTLRDDRPRESKALVNGYVFEMHTADPYPEAEKKIEPEDYVVSIVVKEAEKS